MRLDKYLKVSRIIKRRTVANDACDNAHVTANGRPAKASYDVKVGTLAYALENGFSPKGYIAAKAKSSINDDKKKRKSLRTKTIDDFKEYIERIRTEGGGGKLKAVR